MNIGIQTWGSNGDIRPLLALAARLARDGHAVTLAASSIDNQDYSEDCRQIGVAYRRIPERVEFNMRGFAKRSQDMDTLRWLRGLLDEAFFPYEQQIYAESLRLAHSNDCLIGHHFLYPLKLAARQSGKPFCSVTFCHAAIPTPDQAPFRFPNLGRYGNALSWKVLDWIFNWALQAPLTRLWREHGVTPDAQTLTRLLSSQWLNLVAVDPVFCGGAGGWAPHNQACGFLEFVDDSQVWQMPENLQEFLADGAPPVYMTFGSLQQALPEWALDLFVAAANIAGCRAIIQTPAGSGTDYGRHGDVMVVGKHPHAPVFARCAAVVHHGGAGTTHAATRAGCPSVVVPFMDEQLFWGQRLQQLGLAYVPLPARKVNGAQLGRTLKRLLATPSLRATAQQLGANMQHGDGVTNATHALYKQMRII